MSAETLTQFFMWCVVINGLLLMVWTFSCVVIPDTVYNLQSRWFPMSREHYNITMYSFLGLFKVIYIVFNVVPWIALLLVK